MRAQTEAPGGLEPWLAALHAASERLAAVVDALPERELSSPSRAAGWSIAQVLSHLGSAAEICTGLLERGVAGGTSGPTREEVEPVWARWDAMTAPARREAWRSADARHLQLLDSLRGGPGQEVRVPYFAGLLDLPVYAGYRLSEQSVHAWDVEAALDAEAVIPANEVALLWRRLDLVATRFRDPVTLGRLAPAQLALDLTDPPGVVLLDLDAELHLYPCEPAQPAGTVSGTAEAVLRLVYGRNQDADHVQVTGAACLADLRALFPGF
jgi:uncharacterized protein (TIGR03083 family)